MKKTFYLNNDRRPRIRLIEAYKYEIRKYIKREKNKELPEGYIRWHFTYAFGFDKKEPSSVELADLMGYIQKAEIEADDSFFVEISVRAIKK